MFVSCGVRLVTLTILHRNITLKNTQNCAFWNDVRASLQGTGTCSHCFISKKFVCSTQFFVGCVSQTLTDKLYIHIFFYYWRFVYTRLLFFHFLRRLNRTFYFGTFFATNIHKIFLKTVVRKGVQLSAFLLRQYVTMNMYSTNKYFLRPLKIRQFPAVSDSAWFHLYHKITIPF